METQRCVTCQEIKPLSEFNFKHSLIGKRQSHCRDCQKVYKRNHYLRHKEAYKKRSAIQKEEAVHRNRERVLEYLKTHPCVDCGEADVVVLEFDHISSKDRPIADLVRVGVSWTRIEQEISKCQVRCANCHRKKTAKERGWFRFLGL